MDKIHKKKIVSVCDTASSKPYSFEWKSCWLVMKTSVKQHSLLQGTRTYKKL